MFMKELEKQNCFDRGNLAGIAKCLVFCGFTPIPLKAQKKNEEIKFTPAIPWKDFILLENPLEVIEQVKKLFSKPEIVGIAVKTGSSSKLIVFDVDYPEKFERFYPLQKLLDKAPYVIETKDENHYHIGFTWEPEFTQNLNFLKDFGFEVKVNGLVNFFTVLPEAQYKPIKFEPLRAMSWELKEKILSLLRRSKGLNQKESPEPQSSRNFNLQEIIELASEVYQRGQRQFWTIYVAGYLRKLGIPFEKTKEVLEEFLRTQFDEEIDMRIAGIKHTYMEPLENVKGLTGLLELGLSDEAYLKLRNFKAKEEIGTPKFFTLYDLLTLKVKEPSWIIPNLLPEGFSLLGGKPKVGKSWLALQVALTCVQLGKRVVYFALEDTRGRLQKRLKHLGIIDPEALKDLPILFSFELPKIGKGAIKEIRACIQEFKPDLVIIDPWAKIKPQTKGKDLYLEEYQTLDVFKDFLKDWVNILLVHHTRKSPSEDPLDEILGSTGQTAVVDNVLVLKRGRGSQTAVLHLIPRDFEEADLGLRFENGWKIEGEAKEVMLAEEQKKIVEAIRALESMGEKATIKAITEIVNKSQGAVKVALFDLVQKGIVFRKERGVYSLLNTKRTNFTNFTNLTNFTNFPNFSPVDPEGQKLGKVSSGDKNELTFLSQNLQGLQEKVSLVSKVSSVIKNDILLPTTTQIQTQDQSPTSSLDAKEPQAEEEILLLMPERDSCPICEGKVWKFEKRIYDKKTGVGQCAKCGHISWFGDLSKGAVITKEEGVMGGGSCVLRK